MVPERRMYARNLYHLLEVADVLPSCLVCSCVAGECECAHVAKFTGFGGSGAPLTNREGATMGLTHGLGTMFLGNK